MCYNYSMKKEEVLKYLANVKKQYAEEGFIIKGLFGSYSRGEETLESDIDVLIEATPEFADRYGFGAISRIKEIQNELSKKLGVPVDFADITGLGKTGEKFIIKRTIYV